MTEKKITKRDNFVAIVDALKDANLLDLAEVMEHEIELLDKKALKAKETAAKKKEETDALGEAVAAVLTDELTTIANIASKVDGADVTVAKVTNRLTKLVAAGIARKEQITVEGENGKRKIMAYALA